MSERQIGAQPPDQDCKDVLPHTAQSSDGKDTKDRKKFSVSYLLEKESIVALSSSKDDTDVEQTSPSAQTPALAIFSPASSSSESSISPVSPLTANFINNALMDPNVQAYYHLLISQLNNSAVNQTVQMNEFSKLVHNSYTLRVIMSERQIGAQPPDQDCKDVLPHTAQSSDGKDTKDRKKFSVSYLLEKESTVALSSSKDDTDVEQTSPSAPTPALAIFSPTSSSSESSISPVSPLTANFINNALMDPNVQAYYLLLTSQLNNSAVSQTVQMNELLPIYPHNQVATSSTLPPIAKPEQLLAAKEYLRTGRPCAYKDNGVLDHEAMDLDLGDFTTGLIAENIARRLAHELKLYQIPQKVFGKQVLSRSQGTLSDLLKNPKPWKMLTLRGQETYTKMYKWLLLPLEYKLSILDMHAAETKKTCAKRRLPVSSDSEGPVPRRIRFSDDQKNTLFGVYEKCANPSAEMLQIVANFMEIREQAVSNFFGKARRPTRRQQSIAMTPQLEELFAVLNKNFDQFQDAL